MSIKITDLSYGYGRRGQRAVDSMDLEISKGQFYVLLGPSGCGKTTTMRCIAGLETPDVGRIEIDGRPVLDIEHSVNIPTHKRRIGMVFQSYAIWPHKTVLENVGFPLRMQRMRPKAIRSEVSAILEKVGLEGFEDRGASRLSGGQMQRVALARSLVMRPSVLLFDEPLSNLDARLRESLRFELRDLQREFGFTAVYVTHDQSEALALGDEVAVMRDGRIVQRDRPEDLYRGPKTEFVAAFLGVGNRIEAQVLHSAAGTARVSLTGTSIELDVASSGVPTGENMVACIRDEDLAIGPVTADGRSAQNTINVTVSAASFMGSEMQYLCASEDGLSVKVRGPVGPVTFGPGDEAVLRVDKTAVRLVESEGGQPLGSFA